MGFFANREPKCSVAQRNSDVGQPRGGFIPSTYRETIEYKAEGLTPFL